MKEITPEQYRSLMTGFEVVPRKAIRHVKPKYLL